MKIIKSYGERVEYDPDKIRHSLERTGASKELIEHVIERVSRKVKEGMTTRRLYTIVRRELRRAAKGIAFRYNLRDALLKLGPAGYKFEKYVSSVLNAYQYEAAVPKNDYHGICVNHEVDVVASKEDRTVMIEAKFRNNFSDSVNLRDTMATWARWIDLSDGAKAGKCPRFDELWIVTNGRFSDRSLQYGLCKGIHMVGWSTKESLSRLVDHASLYPITILDDLKPWEVNRFSDRNIMLCREIVGRRPDNLANRLGLPKERVKEIIANCQAAIQEKP
ncbi:hypothetical protein AMJ57_00835 [Parcubacteria bacterium SG8_24]|nr:MAG: hypothetical protein AMJ57_00835 [Parcubacteria bacterium SG8_24]